MLKFFKLLWGLSGFCMAIGVSVENIHEEMTPSERRLIFQTDDKNVQPYEIVPIHWPSMEKRRARAGNGIHLKAFGDDIKLWLTQTDGILAGHDTPVHTVKHSIFGPKFTEHPHICKDLQRYEDPTKNATFVVSERGNIRKILGVISSKNLIIKPLPDRLIEKVRRQRRSFNKISEIEGKNHHYHIIIKKTWIDNFDIKKNVLTKKTPESVYPEILVIVSHDFYEKFDKTPENAVLYLLAFWNAVDLKYRNLENPKFKLNIAGIILAEDSAALTYINDFRYDEDMLVVGKALTAASKFWYKQNHKIDIKSYDVAITMTSYDLCSSDIDSSHESSDENEIIDEDYNCLPGVLGLAYMNGACRVHPGTQTVRKLGIIHDKGAFDGVHTAAHELGHLFGADHDEGNRTLCSANDGYLMAGSPILNENSSDWSKCSLGDLQKFLNTEPTCIYNKPIQKHILPRFLPGRIMDAHKQCKMLEGTEACKIESSICEKLSCIYAEDPRYCKRMGSAAAEGTKCGPKKLCLHGQCIEESEIFS